MPERSKNMLDLLPRYQRVRMELERELAGLDIGAKIPTEHEIVEKYKVSRVTARMALRSLRKDGTVKSYAGRGTFLARKVVPSGTVTGGTRFIGVVVPSTQGQLSEIVCAVEAQAAKMGYHMVLAYDNNDPKLQAKQIHSVLSANVDGLIVYPDREATERSDFLKMLSNIGRKGTPLVLLDRYVAGFELPCVMTDNIRGMYEATEHLICCGRRRIALIGLWENNTVHQDRRKGFMDALRDAGIHEPVCEANTGIQPFDRAAYEIVSGWIKGKDAKRLPFDSIVFMNDRIAHGAFTALRDAGIQVPQQVALVGYDNVDSAFFRSRGLNLTSVEQPLAQMGTIAVEMLVDEIKGRQKDRMNRHRLLSPKLVVRTSCGEQVRAARD